MDYKKLSENKRRTCEHYNNGFCDISLKPNGRRNQCSLLNSTKCYKNDSSISSITSGNTTLPKGTLEEDFDRLKLIINHIEKELKKRKIL